MSAQAAKASDRDAVDELLAAGLSRLRFPPSLEQRYEADRAADRRRHHLIYGALGLLLFDLFLLYDLSLVPDMFETAAMLRLGVVTPLAIAALWGLYLFRRPFVRESSQAAASFVAIAVILYLSAASDSPSAVYHHFGAVLVVVFANIVQRLDFRYAVAGSIASLALCVAGVHQIETLPPEAEVAAVMIMSGGILLTLFANLRMERQLRMAYLFHLRDEMRHEELDALARIDPLTGLGNRRQFDRYLEALWRQPPAEVGPACVIMLDVDHFKRYNDQYGHPAGDLCLKRVATIIAGELRNTADAAFRFGGEEFVVILSRSELMDGVRMGERIRRAVERAAIPHEAAGAVRVVTLSAGAAATLPAGAISADELVASADAALYAAKRNGRNQIWPPLSGNGGPVTYLKEIKAGGKVA